MPGWAAKAGDRLEAPGFWEHLFCHVPIPGKAKTAQLQATVASNWPTAPIIISYQFAVAVPLWFKTSSQFSSKKWAPPRRIEKVRFISSRFKAKGMICDKQSQSNINKVLVKKAIRQESPCPEQVWTYRQEPFWFKTSCFLSVFKTAQPHLCPRYACSLGRENQSSWDKWNTTHWKFFLILSNFSFVPPFLTYLQIPQTESLWCTCNHEFSAEDLIHSLTTTLIKTLKNYLTTHVTSAGKPVQTVIAPPHRQSSSVCLHSHQVTSIFQAKNLPSPLSH